MSFIDKTVVITAAANGIGQAIVERVSDPGVRVVLMDLEAAGLEESRAASAVAGADVRAFVVDCCGDEVASLFATLGEVDVLINAVGSSARERSSAFALSEPEVWQFVHNVSLHSAMLCSRQVVPGMCERRRGAIVNISSDAAFKPTAKMAEYAAAKAGVIGFTRALAAELGPWNIRVNAVAPGLIRTRALDQIPAAILDQARSEIPLGRIGEADDIAAAVSFLAGPEARYITGQTLAVNGGRNFL